MSHLRVPPKETWTALLNYMATFTAVLNLKASKLLNWQEYHKSLSMLFFSILFSRTCNRWNLRTYLITFWINMFERVKQPTAFLSSVSNDWGPLGCLILISSHVIYQLFSSILFHWLNSPNIILPNENDILKENIMFSI